MGALGPEWEQIGPSHWVKVRPAERKELMTEHYTEADWLRARDVLAAYLEATAQIANDARERGKERGS